MTSLKLAGGSGGSCLKFNHINIRDLDFLKHCVPKYGIRDFGPIVSLIYFLTFSLPGPLLVLIKDRLAGGLDQLQLDCRIFGHAEEPPH